MNDCKMAKIRVNEAEMANTWLKIPILNPQLADFSKKLIYPKTPGKKRKIFANALGLCRCQKLGEKAC